MSYTEVVQGVAVTSNVPFDQAQPKGSTYTLDIHWTVPISYLVQLGYDLSSIFGAQAIANEIATLEGSPVTLSNFSLSAPDPSTTRISFSASSPPVLLVILAIFGLAAVIVYLISSATITVVQALGPAVPILGVAFGLALLVGVGVFSYSYFTSKEFRGETTKAATGALRFTREKAAPALQRGVSGVASFVRESTQATQQKPAPSSSSSSAGAGIG